MRNIWNNMRESKRSNDRIDNMESDMNSIKNELDEIKADESELTNGSFINIKEII